MRGKLLKKEIIFGIIILLISTSVIPGLSRNANVQTKEKNIGSTPLMTPEKTSSISMYVFGKAGLEKHDIIVSSQDATQIYAQFQKLRKELAAHPYNEKTQQLEQQFLSLLEEKNVVPAGITQQELMTLLQPPVTPAHALLKGILPIQGKSSEWFCNFATTGEGSAFPIIILPRIIPFILTPIPRAFVYWSTPDGLTSVGGLISHTGFIAGGQQKGIALGFWGIGFSIFLPPIDAYGIFGYALYTKVTAEEIQFWPPNNPPKITQTDPADGQQMVPLSTSELRFSISDADKDLMSYTVTTNPDIGSGSGGLKPSGIYSIPISGLESLTNYTWHISVTDGKDTTEKTSTFTTEPAAPIISNPSPANDEREVSIDITQLQFKLKDYQGDAMEYTVQTSPNIGSDHKIGVHNGTYSVTVSGLTYGVAYRWYVNVTDGTHWTRKVYQFGTGYPSPFDPFAYGWHYRKQITIDHTQIAEDLENFTVLLSTTDPDLIKTQTTGNDILFMNSAGAAIKLHHEIESFDASTGTLIAWINIPFISSNQDTTFYLYYGNPNSIDQSYPQKTWDSNYIMVQHMKDTTTLTISDSTVHNNDGTKTGANEPIQITGKIGNGQEFDGSNDRIDLSSPVIGTGVKTVSMWYYADGGTDTAVFSNCFEGGSSEDDGIGIWHLGGNKIHFYLGDAGAPGVPGHFMVTTSSAIATIGKWHYVTCSYDGTTLSIYINTTLAGSTTTKGPNPEVAGSQNLRFGGRHLDSAYNFNGKLDEIRVSNVTRNASWISTEYNNQNSPSTFLSIGPEEPHP